MIDLVASFSAVINFMGVALLYIFSLFCKASTGSAWKAFVQLNTNKDEEKEEVIIPFREVIEILFIYYLIQKDDIKN